MTGARWREAQDPRAVRGSGSPCSRRTGLTLGERGQKPRREIPLVLNAPATGRRGSSPNARPNDPAARRRVSFPVNTCDGLQDRGGPRLRAACHLASVRKRNAKLWRFDLETENPCLSSRASRRRDPGPIPQHRDSQSKRPAERSAGLHCFVVGCLRRPGPARCR
jgi:hypothetical protein